MVSNCLIPAPFFCGPPNIGFSPANMLLLLVSLPNSPKPLSVRALFVFAEQPKIAPKKHERSRERVASTRNAEGIAHTSFQSSS